MKIIECRTQEELNEALQDNAEKEVNLVGNGCFEVYGSSQVRACGSSQVTAYGSSQVRACGSSQVTAYDSSQVRACGSSQVTAYDSSQVRAYDSSQVRACGSSQVRAYDSSQVTAYDSSQVRACGSSQVTAYDSSQVRACGSSQVRACGSSQVTAYDSSQVRACGSSQVTACGSSQVRASKYVAVTRQSKNAKIKGGVLIKLPTISTARQWCDFYGVTVKTGVATLYKALDKDFKSGYGMEYKPGTTPTAPDWDGGKAECGGGLHFSPRAFMALAYNPSGVKFVACPILLKEIKVHKNAQHPDKVKAPRVFKPCYEVDIDGKPL